MATNTTKFAGLAILALFLLAAPTAAAEHGDIDQVATQENIQRIVQESIAAESEQITQQVSEQVILQHAIVAHQDDEAEMTEDAEEELEDQLGGEDEAQFEGEDDGVSTSVVGFEGDEDQPHIMDEDEQESEFGDEDESEETPFQDDEDVDESEDETEFGESEEEAEDEEEAEFGESEDEEEAEFGESEDEQEFDDGAETDLGVNAELATRLGLLEQGNEELDQRVTDLEERVQVLEALEQAQDEQATEEQLERLQQLEEQQALLGEQVTGLEGRVLTLEQGAHDEEQFDDGEETTLGASEDDESGIFSVASSHMSQPGSQDTTPGFAVVDDIQGMQVEENEDQQDLPQTRILTPNRFGEGALLTGQAESPPAVDTTTKVHFVVEPAGEDTPPFAGTVRGFQGVSTFSPIDVADAEADQDPFAGPATGPTVVNVEAPQQPGVEAPQVTVNVQGPVDRPFTEFGNLPEDATVMEDQPGEADDVDQAAQDFADAVRAEAMADVNAELGGDAQANDAQQMPADLDGDGTVDATVTVTPAEGEDDTDEAEPLGDQDEMGPVDEGENQEGSLVGTGEEGQLGLSSDEEDFEFDPEGGEGGWWGDEGFWP